MFPYYFFFFSFLFPSLLCFVRSFLVLASSELWIHDYTSMHLIPIHDGYVKIQEGSLKFVHLIDILQYDQYVIGIEKFIDDKIPRQNSLYPMLRQEVARTRDMLDAIIPIRKRRSIDVIGKAWKYIAGSPDHDDLEMINEALANLISNNNDQVIVNRRFNERLNNLTILADTFTNYIKKDNFLITDIILNIKTRIQLLRDEIVNIKYALQWAQKNIINTVLLDKKELNMAINKLKVENFPFDTPEEALEFSDVNVLYNSTTIMYVVKMPLVSEIVFESLLLKPVKKDNVILSIKYDKILRNKDKYFYSKNICKSNNEIKICYGQSLVDLKYEKCIPNLLKGLNSSCTFSNNDHIPTIEEIRPGMILLNDFHSKVNTSSGEFPLNGTFLIKFRNESIAINEKVFRSIELPSLEAIPAVAQLPPIEQEKLNLLTIESLHALHINNTHAIKSLQIGEMINTSSSATLLSLVIVLFIMAAYFRKRKVNVILGNGEIINKPEISVRNTIPSLGSAPFF